ncbi:hypothetical protein [Thermoplasma sp.]|uniref:hypothetical protein n=1 Tax=Thermoplasma sp. TaxID=1973142 RepID=UPI001289A3F2|nr:hypothetical protein [Thermoplasma sp.]KAA8923529.1 MAG: hypothetical protein F6Q11_00835 [Thermoplasma sp.]
MENNDLGEGRLAAFLNPKLNAGLTLVFIAFFLIISPLLPGVSWFRLGDFTLDMVNFYHTVMIPFAFLLILYTSELLGLSAFIRKAINISTIPVLVLTVLGMAFFYPSSTQYADYVLQALRDVWMLVVAILFLIGLLIFPFRSKERFRLIWGSYFLILAATVSAGIAAVMGMVYEYGNLFGYSSIPFFNSMVNSWGGLQTFLGNLVTSHSHEMLPAVMGGIVAVAAVSFKYEKLSSVKRNMVNAGMVISLFGVIAMTYLYIISSFGTYVIPTLFPFGPGGMDGLAEDDTMTGIVGWGALISLLGLYYAAKSEKDAGDRLAMISEFFVWLATMAVMVGVGYAIEFNEAFFGFGSPGVPPNGGPGYLYDMAYTNGHLLYAFFMMPLIAGTLILIYRYAPTARVKILSSYLTVIGSVIGGFGLIYYVINLHWILEAIGLAFILLAIAVSSISFFITSSKEKESLNISAHTGWR